MLKDLREVFSGAAMVSAECSKLALKVRFPVDLVTKWNLLWRAHQLALLDQIREEPAQVLWLDPPGAATGSGSRKDHELARFISEMICLQLDIGLDVVLDATSGGHFWKQPELSPALRHGRLRHRKYSWCGLGVQDPTTRRP